MSIEGFALLSPVVESLGKQRHGHGRNVPMRLCMSSARSSTEIILVAIALDAEFGSAETASDLKQNGGPVGLNRPNRCRWYHWRAVAGANGKFDGRSIPSASMANWEISFEKFEQEGGAGLGGLQLNRVPPPRVPVLLEPDGRRLGSIFTIHTLHVLGD